MAGQRSEIFHNPNATAAHQNHRTPPYMSDGVQLTPGRTDVAYWWHSMAVAMATAVAMPPAIAATVGAMLLACLFGQNTDQLRHGILPPSSGKRKKYEKPRNSSPAPLRLPPHTLQETHRTLQIGGRVSGYGLGYRQKGEAVSRGQRNTF